MKVTLHSYARMPEAIWRRLRRLIPKWCPSPKGGRPALDSRRVADGIYYILRTGCQWKAAPCEYGSGSALHNYFKSGRATACSASCGGKASSSMTIAKASTGPG